MADDHRDDAHDAEGDDEPAASESDIGEADTDGADTEAGAPVADEADTTTDDDGEVGEGVGSEPAGIVEPGDDSFEEPVEHPDEDDHFAGVEHTPTGRELIDDVDDTPLDAGDEGDAEREDYVPDEDQDVPEPSVGDPPEGSTDIEEGMADVPEMHGAGTGVDAPDPYAPEAQADGAGATVGDVAMPDDAVEEVSEPPDDQELPLTVHIEEMITRLAIVLGVAAIATVVTFPLTEQFINVIWYHVHPGTVATCPGAEACTPPHLYGPLEFLLSKIKLASIAGLVVALPVFVYETYLFMRPGLYPTERRYYLAAVPTSLVLALIGMAFSYFLVLPAIFTYFLYYSSETAEIAFALQRTFDLILMLLGFMAVVFQIPLLVMLAIMMGITDRQWLESRRLYFWGGFLGVAFLFNPDPTGMAPIIVGATMVVLFEGTLLLLRWTGR